MTYPRAVTFFVKNLSVVDSVEEIPTTIVLFTEPKISGLGAGADLGFSRGGGGFSKNFPKFC